MSFKDEFKNIIPPSKRLREYMEWLKTQPRPDPEKMEPQLLSCKKRHQSKEYQEEERRARANWPKFVEEWYKQHGRKTGSGS